MDLLTIASTKLISLESRAIRNRSSNGKLKTNCLTGSPPKSFSIRNSVAIAWRLPRHDGQNPRPRQLNATRRSALQSGLPLVDDLDTLLQGLRDSVHWLQGSIRVAASQAFARLVLTPQLSDLGVRHPDLRLSLVLSDYFVNLIDQNIDVAFRIGKLDDSGLKAHRVATSHHKLYATRKYLKKHGVPRNLFELSTHRLLFYTRLSELPSWPLTKTGREGGAFGFRPYLECDGSELIREAMLQDVGIALLPTWMIGEA